MVMKDVKTLTASKLIEYAFATPQRRTNIIENALVPPTFIMDTKYPDIERANAHFLASRCNDDQRLLQLDDSYRQQPAQSDHHEARLLNALDAIECARNLDWKFDHKTIVLNGLDFQDTFQISDIKIRVRPNAILFRSVTGLKLPEIGVAKPYFSKTFKLHNKQGKEPGTLYATLLHWYTEEVLEHLGTASPSLCMIGDAFSEKIYLAPDRYKQRRKQLTALVQEISDRWAPVKERMERVAPIAIKHKKRK